MPTDYFIKNLDLVFFVYGLAFVIMGIAILIQPRTASIFKLPRIIGWLAAFGLAHGLNEWLDMFTLIKEYHSPVWHLIGRVVLVLSYFFLFEFGRRLMRLNLKNFFMTTRVAIIWYCLFFAAFLFLPHEGASSWPRYFLGFPASQMTAIGFYLYYRNHKIMLSSVAAREYFMVAAFSIGLYGLFSGLIVSKAAFFPASLINYDSFLKVVGIPVQIFRSFCAILLAWSVWNILGIFHWELIEKLKKEIGDRQQAEKIAQEALQIKSQFVSMVTHELRSPLGAIKESISLVLEGSGGTLSDEQKELLKIAANNVERLTRLINNVLDIQKLAAGKSTLNIEELDLNEVIREAHKTMSVVARDKGLIFTLELSEALPKIKCDRDKIVQVLLNLLNNALRATQKGGVTILSSRGDNFVQVMIKDTGCGIKQEDLGRLFRQFEQIERKSGGSGLGLVITKEIIAEHKGKIWVESVYGQGTTVSFVLPIEEKRK